MLNNLVESFPALTDDAHQKDETVCSLRLALMPDRRFVTIRGATWAMNILVATITLLFALPASAESIYKCKYQEGGFLYQEKPCAVETEPVSSWQSHSDSDAETSGNNTFVIGQGSAGHYFVAGAINDHYLNFLIDTGASFVTIPLNMADSAGLRCKGRTAMQTGNGTTSACLVTIQKLTFGNFTLRNVEALAAPNLNQPLLGMNVLKRFNVEQKNGQMILSRQY